MLSYRLIINVGYNSIGYIFDNLEELGAFLENAISHQEDDSEKDKVEYNIEIVIKGKKEE